MRIVECNFCGTTQTVPNADDEKKTNLFNRANRLRIASEFDRAAGIYESIIATPLKQKQIEDTYARAEKAMTDATNSGDYRAFFPAAELYDSISDFRDSMSKSAECKQLGEKRKAEVEAERARQEELRRQELARQEAERKATEEKRLAEIKAHNDKIKAQIAEADKALATQKAIYAENAGKIFGAGAKLKKAAKAEISRLESEITNLRRNLK